MYCNLAKTPGIPLLYSVSRRSSSSASSKLGSFSGSCHHSARFESGVSSDLSGTGRPRCCGDGFHELPSSMACKPMNLASGTFGSSASNRHRNLPGWIHSRRLGKSGLEHNRTRLQALELNGATTTCLLDLRRGFSGAASQNGNGNGRGGLSRKTLPWIAAYSGKKVKVSSGKRSSKPSNSSWEESASNYFSKKGRTLTADHDANQPEKSKKVEGKRRNFGDTHGAIEEEEDAEPVDDPRWDKIKSGYNRLVSTDAGREKPDVVWWNKQEKWGRKTWKESTESSGPKIVGEGVYGVSPVLAALTAGRRDFYALYIQEGVEFSSNGKQKKRKDKNAVDKILKMAETIGLTVKQTSKHYLNMIVDNRPHQGLVLDASPLEMVDVKELDTVSVDEGGKAPLWVALDEVTDPQNFGAILRSAYFFGVDGVVVCAKNSAPLSGVVSKASVGALEMIELRSCKNMMKFLSSSVENGWRVIGGSVSPKALCLTEVQTGPPTILVLGSEGHGLRPLVERSCTELVKIPGHVALDVHPRVGTESGNEEPEMIESGSDLSSFLAVESLNVSVAAGVLLYHLTVNNGSVVENSIDSNI